MRQRIVLLALVLSGCNFTPAPPSGSVIVCTGESACPDGFICHPFRHECVPPDASLSPPIVLATRLEPRALSQGTAVLTVETDRALLNATVVLEVPESLPVSATTSGNDAIFTFVIGADTPEGAYGVRSITLTDEDQNQLEQETPGLAVVVDRSAPGVRNVVIQDSAPDDGVLAFADLAPFDVLNVDVLVDEDAEVLASVAGRSLECTGDALGNQRCTGSLAASPGGAEIVLIEVSDDAGNTTRVNREIVVDADAPSLVPGSLQVQLESAGGAPQSALGPSVRARVTFVVDEPLDVDPTVTLTGGVDVPMLLVAQNPFTYEVTLETAPSANTFVRVELSDPFGHAQTLTPELPTPFEEGIPPSDVVTSTCPVPASLAGCADFDGDGVPVGADCGQQIDCDDTEPLVFPSAIEIPGDGLDNDCRDGDAPRDRSTGIFVAAGGDDTLGDGSEQAPFASLGRASNALLGERWIFVSGEVPAANLPADVGVLGITEDARVVGNLVLAAAVDVQVDGAATFTSANNVIARANFTNSVDLDGPAIVVEGDFDGLLFAFDSLRIIDSSATSSFFISARVTMVKQLMESLVVLDDAAAELLAVNTHFAAGIRCNDCLDVTLVHSTVRLGTEEGISLEAGSLTLVNSALEGGDSCATITLSPGATGMAAYSSAWHTAGQPVALIEQGLACVDPAQLEDVDELNACTFARCQGASGNIEARGETVGFDPVHEVAGSGLLDVASDAPLLAMPPSVVADIDGECRYLSAPDIGADEL